MAKEITIDYTRQRDLFNADDTEAHVSVVGLGGIGSPSALCLAKLGITSMTLIDPDKVEEHNIPNQMYTTLDVGDPKAEVQQSILEYHGKGEFTATVDTLQNSEDDIYGVVVSGLDSMKARADLWEMVKFNPRVHSLVCARIGIPNIVIFTANPNDPDEVEKYEEYALFDDERAADAPCTARGIMDIGFVVGGLVTRQVRHLLLEKEPPNVISWNQETLQLTSAKWE